MLLSVIIKALFFWDEWLEGEGEEEEEIEMIREWSWCCLF